MAEARKGEELRYESRDVPVRVPVAVAVLTVIVVPVSAALLWLYFELSVNEPPPPSLFSEASEREASPPPLTPNPSLHVPRSIQRMEHRLHSTGWIDREAGIVHIPIDRAMERLVERGVADDLFPLSSPRTFGSGTGDEPATGSHTGREGPDK